MDGRKSYRAMLRLGVTTTTEDASGEVLETKAVVFDEGKIRAAVAAFIGRLEQVPPMYSAVKVNGKKLYELAREGKEIARKARTIEVYDIRIRRFLPPDRVEMDIDCSKGTYIRTLCADIGKALGCGGHMAELLRTATGSFSLENAIKLDDLKALAEQERAEDALLTMQEALRDFPVIKLRRARPSCSITAEKYRKNILQSSRRHCRRMKSQRFTILKITLLDCIR